MSAYIINTMKHYCILFLTVITYIFSSCNNSDITKVDVLIVGGGASGVAAGVQSARLGSNALIIEEHPWLGGMLTSAGVSCIDGNRRLPSGIWGEFRDSLVSHYGSREALQTGWVSNVQFEPSVGNKIFQKITTNEKNLSVWHNTILEGLEKNNGKWIATVNTEGNTRQIEAKIVIDATELGDVAKMCGVKYDIGMDSRYDTNESIAAEKANDIIQDLTYVAVLKNYGKDVSIPRPEGYDSTVFACACKNEICITPKEGHRTLRAPEEMITYGKLPNGKYMINWPLEGNDYYLNIIEMSREERIAALQNAKDFTMKFIYFLQNQAGFNTYGLADDEFPTEDKLPFIPYHRESRRIHGEVRFSVNHVAEPYTQQDKLYRTCIAVGDYPIDHHHQRYTGKETLPDLHFYPVPSFGLPMGCLIPKDVDGLIVAEKSISVTNLVNGATRLQPVVLQIGQAAGTIAALAIKDDKNVREVPVRDVQNALLETKNYLQPFLDVPQESPLFKPYQRVGSTGILRGTGKNVGWSNETWLRVDTLLLASELEGLKEVYPYADLANMPTPVKVSNAIELISQIAEKEGIKLDKEAELLAKDLYGKYELGTLDPNNAIKRGEFAILVDELLDPFNRKQVDIRGNFN